MEAVDSNNFNRPPDEVPFEGSSFMSIEEREVAEGASTPGSMDRKGSPGYYSNDENADLPLQSDIPTDSMDTSGSKASPGSQGPRGRITYYVFLMDTIKLIHIQSAIH